MAPTTQIRPATGPPRSGGSRLPPSSSSPWVVFTLGFLRRGNELPGIDASSTSARATDEATSHEILGCRQVDAEFDTAVGPDSLAPLFRETASGSCLSPVACRGEGVHAVKVLEGARFSMEHRGADADTTPGAQLLETLRRAKLAVPPAAETVVGDDLGADEGCDVSAWRMHAWPHQHWRCRVFPARFQATSSSSSSSSSRPACCGAMGCPRSPCL